MNHDPSADSNRDDHDRKESRAFMLLSWLRSWQLWSLVVCSGLILAPFVIREMFLAQIPDVAESFDQQEFLRIEIPEDRDATVDYRRAALALRQVNDSQTTAAIEVFATYEKVIGDEGWAAADDKLKDWLLTRQDALKIWRRATEKSQFQVIFVENAMSVDKLESFNEREFARLASLEIARCLSEGRAGEAQQWARAVFRFGGHISTRACSMKALISCSLHSMVVKNFVQWAEHPSVTSDQLKQALLEMKQDYSNYDSPSNHLKAEYLLMLRTINSGIFSGADPNNSEIFGRAVKMAFWTFGKPDLSVRLVRQILVNQVPEVDKPVSDRRPVLQTGTDLLFDDDPNGAQRPGQMTAVALRKALRADPLIDLVMPAMIQLDRTLLRRRAKQDALEVVLAAQAFRREHAEFPESLDSLVPDYMEAIPLDPFNPVSAPLKYRRDDTTNAIVWSVGENGTDDGGVIDQKEKSPPDFGFRLR